MDIIYKKYTNIFEIIIEFEKRLETKTSKFKYYFDIRLSVGHDNYPICIVNNNEEYLIEDVVEILGFVPIYRHYKRGKTNYYVVNEKEDCKETTDDFLDDYLYEYEKYMKKETMSLTIEDKTKELYEFMKQYDVELPENTKLVHGAEYLKFREKYVNIIRLNINREFPSIGEYIVWNTLNTFPPEEHLAVIDKCKKCDKYFIHNWMDFEENCCK